MKVEKNLVNRLAQSALVLNTLNRGMTAVKSKYERTEDRITYILKVPSISAQDLEVEMDKDYIYIYQQMEVEPAIDIPLLIKRIKIPTYVNQDKIEAEVMGTELHVKFPNKNTLDLFG